MKNIIPLFTPYKKMKMTPEEKDFTWKAISARTFLQTEKEPVRKPILSRLYYGGLLPAIKIQNVLFQKKKYAFGAFASTMIISGSISAFAQGALPGDLLYLVKTNVNEKLKIVLALTPEEKAKTEAILATKRLEETEVLLLEGKLSPTLIKQTSEAFKTHVNNFEKYLVKLEEKSNFAAIKKIGVLFQTRIAVHTTILKEIETKNDITITSKKEGSVPLGTTTNSLAITNLKNEVLLSVIPTVIITKKAFVNATTAPKEKLVTYKSIYNQHFVPLEVDPDEAKKYLKVIEENTGIHTSSIDTIPVPLVPTVVQ